MSNPAEIYVRPQTSPVSVVDDGDLQVFYNGVWVFFKNGKAVLTPDPDYNLAPVKPADKYGVVVDGPDDILGPFTEVEALKKANEINLIWIKECRKSGIDETPLHIATVEPWNQISDPDLQ